MEEEPLRVAEDHTHVYGPHLLRVAEDYTHVYGPLPLPVVQGHQDEAAEDEAGEHQQVQPRDLTGQDREQMELSGNTTRTLH